MRRSLREARGAVWLLADRPLLEADNAYYGEAVKAYVSGRVREPDYVGLDARTLAVRLTPSRNGSGAPSEPSLGVAQGP